MAGVGCSPANHGGTIGRALTTSTLISRKIPANVDSLRLALAGSPRAVATPSLLITQTSAAHNGARQPKGLKSRFYNATPASYNWMDSNKM